LVGDKWVVKVAKKQTMQPEQAILDYMATIEELIKYIPETHYFEFDNKFGVQVQRRCDVIDYLDSDERRLVTNDPQYQELVQILENYGITDIHEGNIGYDETGQIKVIDVGGWNE
jgi:penicillin V acylase-like amidase (Ntn superfamily)